MICIFKLYIFVHYKFLSIIHLFMFSKHSDLLQIKAIYKFGTIHSVTVKLLTYMFIEV